MKVCIGSPGRFHTFDLARQMERLGLLQRLYTGYPRWKVDGLDRARIRTFPWVIGPMMLAGRLGCHGLQEWMNWPAIASFDRWMAARLEPCQVFHCLSSFGQCSHHVAKDRFGALTVCDRGSAHILFMDHIYADEYARWGLTYRPIDRRIVERELWEYEHCDRIVVPSGFARQTFLQKALSAEKVVKVSFGVDLRMFQPLPKTDNVFRVIYVGALSLRKGVPYLLQALASLKLPRLEAWLLGSLQVEMRPFLEKYNGVYRYWGIQPRSELHRYYSQGSVFVLPSLQEGLALVLAQAMACGLPIIATANSGAEDLITDGVEGFIVPIRDPAAIKEKLAYLHDNPSVRDSMALAALTRARKQRGWDAYGEQMAANYQVALARKS